MTSREQFEASAAGHYMLCERDLSRDECEPEDYADSEVQVAWEFWKASRETIEAKLPFLYPFYKQEVTETLISLGLRVAP